MYKDLVKKQKPIQIFFLKLGCYQFQACEISSTVTLNYYVRETLKPELYALIEPGFSSNELRLVLLTEKGVYKRALSKIDLTFFNRFKNGALSFLCPFQDLKCILSE